MPSLAWLSERSRAELILRSTRIWAHEKFDGDLRIRNPWGTWRGRLQFWVAKEMEWSRVEWSGVEWIPRRGHSAWARRFLLFCVPFCVVLAAARSTDRGGVEKDNCPRPPPNTKVNYNKASWPKTSKSNRQLFGNRRFDFEVFGHEALI